MVAVKRPTVPQVIFTRYTVYEGYCELECMFLPPHPTCFLHCTILTTKLPAVQLLYANNKNILPGCTGTSLVSFCSGAIPSGRQESGTAGAECFQENHSKVTSLE